jgi:hemolysin activation/secretion protein
MALTMSSAPLGAQILPPPPTNAPARPGLAIPPRLVVKGFRFEGNHAFSSEELAQVTKPFTQRELGSDELEQARRAVTLHYVTHGYVNSGAIIPDQSPTNGIIFMKIVEGKLSEINVHGNKWLRDGYIRSHLERWSEPPLKLTEVQEGLQLLRLNPNVNQINAELKPGSSPGEGLLDVTVKDEQPFRLGLQVDNQRPPSVGALQISLLTADMNLTGHSDPLLFRYGIANSTANGVEFSGADNLDGSYDLPVTRYDTTIGVHGSRLNTSIIENPFLSLDIASLTSTLGFAVRQPIYQTPNQEVALSVGFDYRENDSSLLGEAFNISPGAVNGVMKVSVLRLSQEWFQRGANHVLALRSTFNIGLDALGATDDGIPGDPNGQFFSWVGQAQYVQRLFNTQNQMVLRLSGQMTGEPLLALEQISIGGFNTVRGYPENTLVRDRGIISSVEFRVPLLFNKSGEGTLSLAPFFDFGGGWNLNESPNPTTIYSTGVGCLFKPGKHFSAEVYWGYRIQDVDVPSNSGLQKQGINFRFIASAF